MKDIKNVTIKEITKLVKPADVEKAHLYYYPSLKIPKGFIAKMFDRITKARKGKGKDNERIEIYGVNTLWEDGDLDSFYGVHTIEEGVMEYGRTKSWSMSFRPWDDLISMKISDNTLESYTLKDILAHFIYEITWHGNEKEMRKKGKELFSTVKKIKKSCPHPNK